LVLGFLPPINGKGVVSYHPTRPDSGQPSPHKESTPLVFRGPGAGADFAASGLFASLLPWLEKNGKNGEWVVVL